MDMESVDSHLSIRMTRFYMKIVGMWYVEEKSDRLISNFVLAYTILTMLIALVVMGTDFYYSWGDLHAISYNAPCTITVLMELFKLLIFVFNRQKVMDFNAFTENTFWKIKYKLVDLTILNRCNEQTMRMNGVFAILMQIIAWHYLSIPMAESIGKDSSQRILPFKLWFDLPFTETPYYEIAFSLQAAATLSVAICTTTFGSFLFTTCIYATGQFNILQRRLEVCCDSYLSNVAINPSDKKSPEHGTFDDLKAIVIHHQMLLRYMERLENLYCYIMLGEALGAVLQICFSGFQVILGAEESIPRTALSIEFLGGSVMILYLFSWACQEIIDKSTTVAEAAYRGSWHDLPHHKWGQAYRHALIMIVTRARRACILTVGKFTPMSLETFTSVISTSMSYFTILRQMNEEQ